MPDLIESFKNRWRKFSGFFMRFSDAPSHKQSLGWRGERVAGKYLQQQGYRIVARNHRLRRGEIDLIALDGECIVFVEVKTWVEGEPLAPAQAVDSRKQRNLIRAAHIYLKQKHLLESPARFDVVAIVWPDKARRPRSIEHIRHAFDASAE